DPSGTRAAAPEGYDAKTLHVEIKNAEGTVMKSTDNFAKDEEFQGNIKLLAGTYTIIAHSANWDGNGSGFGTPYYYGSSTVTVKPKSLVKGSVTCTQANVKLTVNYDQSFVNGFKSAKTTISSVLDGISPLEFVMNETTQSGYIPADDFTAKLDVVNKNDASYTKDVPFTNVQPRDHYILNFKVAEEGNLGDGTNSGIEVEVDESTNTYTFTFEVPRKASISLVTRAANAWSTFAMLNAGITAKTDAFNNSGLVMQWRKAGETEWTEIANSELTVDATDNVTTTLKGLTPETTYECRLRYVDGETEVASDPVSFTTEKQIPLYNGGFENWWMDDKVAYPNAQGTSFWDTSNPGAASFGGSITTQETSIKHSGNSAAKLESKYIVIKFAAASMYTGTFGELVGTSGAKLNWGVPFTSRPTALKGYMQYAPVNIVSSGNQGYSSTAVNLGGPNRNEPDVCGMYCVLLSASLKIDNTKMDEFPDWETDSRVIAYGSLKDEQNVNTNGQWQEVNIPLVYRDLTRKPTHLLVVFSASKYGDYFHGGKGSLLYVDDFELVYGDNPSVK
ncbi:MAG: PCMD domain-containing protein, partial [Bacteroidaceae bacterium]|nr:PCMD domain-containing protein [Bacteroidaceae bacterium]